MTIPIDGAVLGLAEPATGTARSPEAALADTSTATSFEDLFKQAIENHSARAREASEMAASFAAGKTQDIHGTMIAIKEVEIELHVLSNVRRKVVDAFQELWRMNI